MKELSNGFEEDFFTVGFTHECIHRAACGEGVELKAIASLITSEGNTFIFKCTVWCDDGILITSRHTRKKPSKEKILDGILSE